MECVAMDLRSYGCLATWLGRVHMLPGSWINELLIDAGQVVSIRLLFIFCYAHIG